MKTRIITAVALAAILIPVGIFSDTVAYPILLSVMGAIGVFEMIRCIGMEKNLAVDIPAIGVAVVMPFVTYFNDGTFFTVLTYLTSLMMFWLFTVSVFSHGKIPVERAAMVFFGWFYVVWGFSAQAEIRYLPHGEFYCMLPFLGAWVTDSFAYFTGRAFGRHKLIPEVSPKKTVEGAIGGVVFAVIGFAIFGWITVIHGAPRMYGKLMLIAVPVSVVSMIGDLAMSLVKRHYGVKDYGKILPGHGGILDRFDSLLATALIVRLLVEFF